MKKIFCIIFILTTNVLLDAQSFWKKSEESRIQLRSDQNRSIIPDVYDTYTLDIDGLRNYLANAPMELAPDRNQRELLMDVPMSDGTIEKFKVYESPVMQEKISARYPSIKSYKAYSTTNKSHHMRFTLAPNGYHASIMTLEGEVYIDPYSSESKTEYIVYNVSDYHSDEYKGISLCGVEDTERFNISYFRPSQRNAPAVQLRVYKLAMACSGEWGQRRGSVALALADMNTMVARMNSIYEKDMAMRFVLIDDNDKLIFLDPATDPYTTPESGRTTLGNNTNILNQRVASTSYDIGHVLLPCTDIGGVAQGGSACQSNKGNGVTCHLNQSLSVIVTRVMAHEIGHQFNASHTWNICQPNVNETAIQRAAGFAYEPGSGSTIMSYAGSCGVDNVASDNDDYFHIASLEQMTAKTTSGGNAFSCADILIPGNRYPVIVSKSPNVTIPQKTPFELIAKATDEDGDALTYTWEQYDLGESIALGSTSPTAPLFRSNRPSSSGDVRFLPRREDILSGNFTSKTEVLPDTDRKLNFKITVRDNSAQAGGVVWENVALNVTSLAGPFKITFPTTVNTFKVGQNINVTWDVAKTDEAPVNCKLVNVYGSVSAALRTDDANLIPLALNVPNDGSQEVTIPNNVTNFFRIVIKAADNIFLTGSPLPSRVEISTTPGFYFEPSQTFTKICQPGQGKVEFSTLAFGGFSGTVNYSVLSGLPAGAKATFSPTSAKPGDKVTLTIDTKDVIGDQNSNLVIKAVAVGLDSVQRTINIQVKGNNLSGLNTLSPANGTSGVTSAKFNWMRITDAENYEFQLATSPDFSAANMVVSNEISDTSFAPTMILKKTTIHYWRVRAKNECGTGNWSLIKAFMTEALACKIYESGVQAINISASGSPTVELELQVFDEGTVSDVNVKMIRADHSRVVDLVAFLVAPSGKETTLWSRKCGTTQNVFVGLDDQSTDFFQCPINTGNVYRPDDPLSALNRESIKGAWKLRMEDRQSGSGGRLTEMNLELCSNITLDQPFLVKNDTLKIHPGNQSPITNLLLLANDNNNTAVQLIYTIVSTPLNGTLFLNGTQIGPGAQFTQADINAFKIKFVAKSNTNTDDFFTFTVTDGQGGWIAISPFNIKINQNFVNSANDFILTNDVYVAPNPTADVIHITLSGKAIGLTKYYVTDLAGRNIIEGNLSGTKDIIELQRIQSGIYFIKLTDGRNTVTKKVIKI